MRIEPNQVLFFGNQIFQWVSGVWVPITPEVLETLFIRVKMARLNTGAYGQTIYADLEQDITGGTELTFILQPQRGDKQIKTDHVSIGLVNIVVGDYQLIANQYLEYVIQEGDLAEKVFIGTGWRTKGECVLGSSKIIGDYKKITVLE